MDIEAVTDNFTELDGGVDEAVHYMRRPVAVAVGREPEQVLTRYAPLESVWSDSGALAEVFVRYADLVVATATNGSPLLSYLNEPHTWCAVIDGWMTKMLPGDGAPVSGAQAVSLHIDGVDVPATAVRRRTALVVAPPVGGRLAQRVVVAISGVHDELTLRFPDQQLVAAMFMGGHYPRFSQWPPVESGH